MIISKYEAKLPCAAEAYEQSLEKHKEKRKQIVLNVIDDLSSKILEAIEKGDLDTCIHNDCPVCYFVSQEEANLIKTYFESKGYKVKVAPNAFAEDMQSGYHIDVFWSLT